MHTNSIIDDRRMEWWRASHFNPIRFLTTPQRLVQLLEEYASGRFADSTLAFQAMAERDDILKCVVPKRISAIARRTFEIVIDKGAKEAGLEDEALKHKQCLEYLYKNMRVTSALDGNQRGGFRLMVKQMMSATGLGYAAHEIIWKPESDGKEPQITAQMKFVPLQFFENRTGNLRFLPQDGMMDGVPLEEGGWMVTCGDALMIACSILYIYKRLTWNQSNAYEERNAMPAFIYKTNAQPGTDEHEAAKDMAYKLSRNFAGVTNMTDVIEVLQLGATGTLPYPEKLEMINRALASLWMGADLSTISAVSGAGQGASLQQTQQDALEQDDGQNLSETLNEWVDRPALEWKFGKGVKPLAYVKIIVPNKVDFDQQIKIDDHFLANGIPIGVEETRERYQRAEMDEDDDLLERQPPVMAPEAIGSGAPARGGFGRNSFGNEAQRELHGQSQKLIRNSIKRMADAQEQTLKPVMDRLKAVFEFEGQAWEMAMEKFKADLPEMLESINKDPETSKVLEGVITAAQFNAIAEGMVDRRVKA